MSCIRPRGRRNQKSEREKRRRGDAERGKVSYELEKTADAREWTWRSVAATKMREREEPQMDANKDEGTTDSSRLRCTAPSQGKPRMME